LAWYTIAVGILSEFARVATLLQRLRGLDIRQKERERERERQRQRQRWVGGGTKSIAAPGSGLYLISSSIVD
jgi:hypothetical protein